MKVSISRIIGAVGLTLSAALLFITLSSCAPTPVTTIPPTTVAPRVVYANDGFDWGWLGLIGLFGLAGLAGGRKRRDIDTTTRY